MFPRIVLYGMALSLPNSCPYCLKDSKGEADHALSLKLDKELIDR